MKKKMKLRTCNAPVKVNSDPLPTRDLWGLSGALSPYWQLFESPVCGEFARFVAFVLRNVGHLVGDSFLFTGADGHFVCACAT